MTTRSKLGAELLEHVAEQVVGQRTGRLDPLQRERDRRRLRSADEDRELAVAALSSRSTTTGVLLGSSTRTATSSSSITTASLSPEFRAEFSPQECRVEVRAHLRQLPSEVHRLGARAGFRCFRKGTASCSTNPASRSADTLYMRR